MANMLISDKMAVALENLMGMFFQANRMLDRMSSQLSVKFVMPNTTEIFHKQWAHQMPLIGDLISDYCDDRNYAVSYPETTKDYTEYQNLTELCNKILDYMIDIEATTSECIDLAEEDDDKMTKYFLEKFLYEQVRNYTKLALNFVDYVEKNGDEPVRHLSMDARINKFLNMPTLSVGEYDD